MSRDENFSNVSGAVESGEGSQGPDISLKVKSVSKDGGKSYPFSCNVCVPVQRVRIPEEISDRSGPLWELFREYDQRILAASRLACSAGELWVRGQEGKQERVDQGSYVQDFVSERIDEFVAELKKGLREMPARQQRIRELQLYQELILDLMMEQRG